MNGNVEEKKARPLKESMIRELPTSSGKVQSSTNSSRTAVKAMNDSTSGEKIASPEQNLLGKRSREDADYGDELPSPEELSRMSRSERKRHREKKRRNDVNKGFDELMSLLLEIDPDVRAEAEERARRGQWKGGFGAQEENLLSRVDLIARAVQVLRRVHRENEERKQIIAKLTGGTAGTPAEEVSFFKSTMTKFCVCFYHSQHLTPSFIISPQIQLSSGRQQGALSLLDSGAGLAGGLPDLSGLSPSALALLAQRSQLASLGAAAAPGLSASDLLGLARRPASGLGAAGLPDSLLQGLGGQSLLGGGQLTPATRQYLQLLQEQDAAQALVQRLRGLPGSGPPL